MRVSFRSIVIHVVLACPVALVFAGCSGTVPSSTSVVSGGTQVDVSPSGPIGNSPNTAAAQGVAINGNQSAYVSSNNWLAAYNANWTLQWKNTNELAGLPSAVTHIGDIDYYNGKLIAPVENYTGCNAFAPVLLAVYDAATGSLVTWSDITANGHEASSVTVIAEKNQLVVSDFCSQVSGRNKLWIYDLNAVLNNPAGSVLSAIGSIQLTPPLNAIQGISWNANVGQFLVTTDIGGPAGSLWYIAPDGTVTGPAYVVPGTGELEGADFSTGNIYYLLNGYVYGIGAPPAAPVLDPAPGTFTGEKKVTVTDATPGAVIYYTTNGSMPTTKSPIYTDPVKIHNKTTFTAIAVVNGTLSSPATVGTYTNK